MDTKSIIFLFAVLTTSVACIHAASNSLLYADLSGEHELAAAPVDRPFVADVNGPVKTVAPEERRSQLNRTSFATAMSDLEVIQAKRNLRTGIAGLNAQQRNTEYRLKTEYGIDVLD